MRSALWSNPDPLLTEAGAKGEILVAKIRLLLTSVLLLIPIVNSMMVLNPRESGVGLVVIASAFLLSLIAYGLVARGFHRWWLGFATSSFDVTLVSAALATFLLFNEPHTAVNSKVVFEGYFLAIGGTCLRYDRRICLIAGVLALGEYFGIVLVATSLWDLNSDIYAPFLYGAFNWSTQISRLILLLTACLLSIAVVTRTQELLRLSNGDPLTGLFNRSHFDERVAIEVSRAYRYRLPLAIAMVDVDHFKSFNDTYGHAAGDLVLKAIGSTLRNSFRKSDIVGRYGGEEFVIAMPETDRAAANRKLESLRQTIATMRIPVPTNGKAVGVTISAGLAGFPDDGTKQEELLGAADARLFRAKGDGRNRIVG